jgi:cyclase
MLPRMLGALALSLTVAGPLVGQQPRKVTQLAPGVYAIEHAEAASSGNTMVIIGDRQVFVVDACYLPSAAREDIAQIRQWTNKPVAFVLNTHFHNDHNIGNRIYMDEFPAVTIIAHTETKREEDLFGPSSARRMEADLVAARRMLETGKGADGTPLTPDDRKQLTEELPDAEKQLAEVKAIIFQSPTLTFDHDFTIDLGNREVDVKFLGRGNTGGDAVAYLPKEKIVATGDLVAYPIPNTLDGYPSEWVHTLERLAQLDATTIMPGHGPVLRDKTYMLLVHDLLQSAVDQMTEKLRQTKPAMFQSLDDVKGGVNLTPFRHQFIGADSTLGPAFDEMAAGLVKLVYEENTLH